MGIYNPPSAGGSGNVSGPGSSVDTSVAVWNGTDGKTLASTFYTFTGPASTLKTFTLPNASDTVACLAQQNNFTKQQYFGTATLTDGASIAWDVSIAQNAKVTLGGARTMAAPSNLVDGGQYTLRVIQDGTGGRTLAYNSVFKWPAGVAPTVSTAIGAIDIISCISDGTNLYCAIQKAFA